MTTYVALLRGIAPMNPNQQNVRLREVAERLGLTNVATALSSGNLLFESDTSDRAALEDMLEAAWPRELGFESTSIVRTADELEALRDLNPFGELEHGRTTYLLVTFTKGRIKPGFSMPHEPGIGGCTVVGATDRELFTVTDTETVGSPNTMSWLENESGKQITSRTWLTVLKVLEKCGR